MEEIKKFPVRDYVKLYEDVLERTGNYATAIEAVRKQMEEDEKAIEASESE